MHIYNIIILLLVTCIQIPMYLPTPLCTGYRLSSTNQQRFIHLNFQFQGQQTEYCHFLCCPVCQPICLGQLWHHCLTPSIPSSSYFQIVATNGPNITLSSCLKLHLVAKAKRPISNSSLPKYQKLGGPR